MSVYGTRTVCVCVCEYMDQLLFKLTCIFMHVHVGWLCYCREVPIYRDRSTC